MLDAEQARETAAEYFAKLPEDIKPTTLLCSPFLRVIQTCAPTADALGKEYSGHTARLALLAPHSSALPLLQRNQP